MRTVAIIPARGGSSRIPMKNIKLFHGRPIIYYSIEAAIKSELFDAVYVSTDSEEIMEVAGECGAAVMMRAPEMSVDAVGTQEVMWHVLNRLNRSIEIACCIYATAPMMQAQDLKLGFDLVSRLKARYAFSVGTDPLHDAGQFYFGRANSFLMSERLIDIGTRMVPIPKNRVMDINTPEDWLKAEAMYAAL